MRLNGRKQSGNLPKNNGVIMCNDCNEIENVENDENMVLVYLNVSQTRHEYRDESSDDFIMINDDCYDIDLCVQTESGEWIFECESIRMNCGNIEHSENGNIFCCDECNEYFYTDDAFYTDDNAYCSSCYEECCTIRPLENNYKIHSYHAKTDFNIPSITEQKNDVYLGIELETVTSCEETITKKLRQYIPNNVLCYRDSSLITTYDFCEDCEIVTNPRKLSDHLRDFKGFFENNDELWISSQEYHCGLHVHVSKLYFGEEYTDQYRYKVKKLLRFFAENQSILESLSGRLDHGDSYDDAFRYCEFYSDASAYSLYSRYQAINFSNDETIEFRFFSGTDNFERFKLCLTFIDQLVRFIGSLSNGYTMSDFLVFIGECKLSKWIKNHM